MVASLRLAAVLLGAVAMAPAEVVTWTTACNNGPQATCSLCEQGSADGPGCVTSTSAHSLIDHLSGTFIHDAVFYGIGEDPGGCLTCGAAARPSASGLPSLSLARYYRSRVFDLAGSLGVDHFLSTDANLRFDWSGPGGTKVIVRYADPAELSIQQRFFEQVPPDAAVDGVLHTTVGLFRDLRLYDASHALTASALLATTAVITDHDGGTRTFEVIDLGNGPTRYGRLLRIADRVGVEVQSIAYRYPANASSADLGYDRSRLWQVTTVTAADQTRATYTYDTINRAGRYPVASILLPNGSTTAFHYDGDFLVSQDLPARGVATFLRSYDPHLQKIRTVIDDPAAAPNHQKKTVWWSGATYILPGGAVIPQSEGQLFRIDNAAGETMYMAWNSAQPTAELAADKYVWTSERGLERFEVTAAAEQIKAYARAPGFIFSLAQDPGTADFSERTVYINDREHQLVLGEIDPIGRRRNFTYDAGTRSLTSVTDAAGSITRSTYNDRVEPLTRIDELGRITTYAYDAAGNQVSKTVGSGSEVSTWQWLHDARGLVTAQIDANGNRTDLLYDARGRLIRIIEPADAAGGTRYAREFSYDGISRLTAASDQAGRVVTYAYDVANRLIRRTYSDGSREELIYGSGPTAGLLVMEIDRNGVPTTYAYDAAGRRIETRVADGRPEVSIASVTYAPGSATRIGTRVVDGDATTMIYDPQARRIAENSLPRVGTPLTRVMAFDPAERDFAQRDPYRRWTYRAYDPLDRVVRTIRELVPGAIGSPAELRAAAVAAQAAAFSGSDIGSPTLAGSSSVAGGLVTIQGAGGPSTDQSHYHSSALASDATFTVRLDSQTHPDPWSTAGIMVRQSLAADAPFIGLFATAAGVSLHHRDEYGGLIAGQGAVVGGQPAPLWLRAQIADAVVRLSTSADGLAWAEVGVLPFHRQEGARIGLSVASGIPGQWSTAVFSHLELAAGVLDTARIAVLTNDFLASMPRSSDLVNPGYVIEETAYDASGRPIAHHDGRNIRSTIGYDSQARLVAMTEAVGTPEAALTAWRYDAQGNRIAITDPRGFITAMAYTGRNLLARTSEADGTPVSALTLFTYSPTQRILTTTDALGRTTTNTYEPCCDRLASVIDPAGFTTRFTYDFVGNRTSVTDPNGLTVVTTYDGRNRPVAITNGAGETTTMAYIEHAASLPEAAGLGLGAGADGFAVSTTNPLHERSMTIFDGALRKVRQIDGLGHQTTFTFDGQMVDQGATLVAERTIDPLGHATIQLKDGAERIRVDIDALDQRRTIGYDAAGNRVTWRDPNAVGKDVAFDARNREVLSIDTAGAVTRRAYDADGNLTAITDALQQVESMRYDARDRRISLTDRMGATTTFAYDAVSNLLSITDAEGGRTLYAYDPRNLLISESFPQSGNPAPGSTGIFAFYGYDAGRRLVWRSFTPTIPPLGAISTAFDYDGADRIIRRHHIVSQEVNFRFPPGPSITESSVDTFSYDTAGRLKTAVSQQYANEVARDYDAAGRLIRETLSLTDPGEAVDLPVSYAYDADDEVTQVTYPDGSQVQRAHTPRHELAAVGDGGAAQIVRSYDAGGRLGRTRYGNGIDEFRTYAAQDNLTASISSTGNVTNFTYAYDAGKRTIAERDWQIGGNSQRFRYDAEDRLVERIRGVGAADAAGETESWQLSPVGDWTIFTRAPASAPAITESRRHDPLHEVIKINGIDVAYDSYKGRLRQDNRGQLFTWDFEDHLVTADHLANGRGDHATYGYDALGRRVRKTVATTDPAHTVTTYFVNAGAREVVAITGDVTAFNDPAADPEDAGAAPYAPATGAGARGSLLAEPTATRINFQPAQSDTPDGWQADAGGVQPTPGQRGWTTARTAVDRDHLGRPLYDTFVQLDAATWKLPVANGTHAVVIMCGDADSRAQTNNLVVNGVPVTDATPFDGSPTRGYETGAFDGYALTVAVSDGFITIHAGIGGLDPKLNFIEVGAAGTAADAATVARVAAAAEQATHDTAKPRAKSPPTVKRSVWGDYVDELASYTLALPRHAAKRYFVHADNHYSVMALTDGAGSVVERYAYSAYGEPRAASTRGNDRGFAGQRYDAESALYDVRARMYSPTLGRFLTRDATYDDGFNLYEYVQGRPADLLDPFGHASWDTSNTSSNTLPVIGPAGAGVLATTIGSLTVATTCKCSRKDGKWYLDNTKVDFNININYWTDTDAYKLHRAGLTYNWVKAREKEHAKDFKDWADKTGKKLADDTEKDEKKTGYGDKATCESTTKTNVEGKLNPSLATATAATIATWDTTGKHTWGGPNQIP